MRYYLSMILASLFLGGIGIFTKLIDGALPLLTLNFLRLFIATLFLAMVLKYVEPRFLIDWKEKFHHNVVGGILIAIAFSLYVIANALGPVTNAVFLLYTNPLFVLLFALFILKEKISSDKLIALVLGFAGLALINPLGSGNPLANAFALTAAVFYAGYIVYLRKHSMKQTIGYLFYTMGWASLFVLPFAIVELALIGSQALPYAGFTLSALWIVPLALFSTAFAYLLYTYALESLEAEVAATISMILTPLTAVLLAILLFSETLTTNVIVGGLLLIGGLVYLQQRMLFCKTCEFGSQVPRKNKK